ncbi:MAG: hypothetical protein KDA25_13660 [Phycisphaerales bacterium]|nr:hypothetical protein [Phycisphaerales bacterium]
MTKNTTSPYATSFKSAMKKGTPCMTAINKIAKRCNKTCTSVCNSLYKAGCVNRQKFNGQWVYWANCPVTKCKASVCNDCQTNMWQCFVDWCIASGCCTPMQLNNCCGSQKAFMASCRKFFAKQFSSTTKTTGKKNTVKKGVSAKKTTVRGRKTSNYTFPGRTRSTRKAA